METQTDFLGYVVQFAQNYPWAATVLMVIGVFRAIFKPIMTLADAYVQATPSISDNEKLNKFKQTKVYKALVWFVDYTTSLKIK